MTRTGTETETTTNNVITLSGSVSIVTEFFHYAINSILYQRNIYPAEDFRREEKYGLTVLTATNPGLVRYLEQIMSQMGDWLTNGNVQRLVVVVSGVDSLETLERWQFDVNVEDGTGNVNGVPINAGSDENSNSNIRTLSDIQKAAPPTKSIKEINAEIAAIIRQVTASVTFLPLLNEPCSFDLLVYTDREATVPVKWEESDPKYIVNSNDVKLRSFNTTIHKVDSMVSYKEADEWDI